jgi:hypothetical protein
MVKFGQAFGDNAIQLPRGDQLVRSAVAYLNEFKGVTRIAIYDGPCGGYGRVPINEVV